MALSRGKSVEKNEIRISQRGQFSTSERSFELNGVYGIEKKSHTFVEDYFIPKNFDFNVTSGPFNDTYQDLPHGPGSRLDVHRTDP